MQNLTMKDLAEHFGVSLNTIHKAINGKAGVSDQTRAKILAYAAANGYRVNPIASTLKKKELRIGICYPGKSPDSRFFYDAVWRGIRHYFDENERLYNIRAVEFPYHVGQQTDVLDQLLSSSESEALDGLLLNPPRSSSGLQALRLLERKGLPVVFVTDDNPESHCLGAVGADYYTAGRMMAEQFLNLREEGGDILLLSGDPAKDSHYLMCQGFSDYNRENKSRLHIRNICGYRNIPQTRRDFVAALRAQKPDLCGSVYAVGSALLSEVLTEEGLAGKVLAIGNDLFRENVAALENGTFRNLVYKNPERQGYLSAKMLCDYLVSHIEPAEKHIRVEASMIFRSNVFYYTDLAHHAEGVTAPLSPSASA